MIPSCKTFPRKQPSRLVWKSWCFFYCKYCISNSSKNRHQTACFTKQFQNNRSGSGGPRKSRHRYRNDAVHRRQLWFPTFSTRRTISQLQPNTLGNSSIPWTTVWTAGLTLNFNRGKNVAHEDMLLFGTCTGTRISFSARLSGPWPACTEVKSGTFLDMLVI